MSYTFWLVFVLTLTLEKTNSSENPSNFMGQNEEIANILVIQNQKAELPCNIQPKRPGGKVATVLWYKGTFGEPIFTYDSRNSQNGNATVWTDEVHGFGLRARFEHNARPDALLIVDGIRLSESGTYRCRVDFLKAQTRNYLLNLTVVVPPPAPRIIDDNGKRIGTVSRPLDEGSSLILICISQGGHPPPSLNWFSSSNARDPVDTSYEVVESALQINEGSNYTFPPKKIVTVHNTLQIRVLSRKHLGKTFICVAKNNDVTPTSSINITLDMRLLPINVSIVKSVESFSVSKETLLECRSYGSRPPATLTWWKRGKFIGNAPTKIIHEKNKTYSSSQIQIRLKPNDHGKEITCRSENTNIPGSAIQDNLRLDVQYPPKVLLNLGKNLDLNNIAEGNDVYLECLVKSNPIAYKIEWHQNKNRLSDQLNRGIRIVSGGKNLVIQGVKRSHTGNYTCTAFNVEGDETSSAIALDVKYKPECYFAEVKVFGISSYRKTEVICRMSSYPEVQTFSWSFNDSQISETFSKDSYVRLNGSSALLSYEKSSFEGVRYLRCFGSNERGESSLPCVFKLIAAGPPEAPLDCDVRNHTTKGLGVTCQKGFDGGLSQTFHMEVRDRENGQLIQNQTNEEPVFYIRGFKTTNKGINLKLYTSNSYGKSLNSVHLETTPSKVAELQIETALGDSSREYLGILLGTVGTLSLVVIISLIFVCSCHKQSFSSANGQRPSDVSSTYTMEMSDRPKSSDPRIVVCRIKNDKERFEDNDCRNVFDGKSQPPDRSSYLEDYISPSSALPSSTGLDRRPPPPPLTIFDSSSRKTNK